MEDSLALNKGTILVTVTAFEVGWLIELTVPDTVKATIVDRKRALELGVLKVPVSEVPT